MNESAALLVTAEPATTEAVLAVAASVSVGVEAPGDDAALRQSWRGAPAVFVGIDKAASVLGLGLPQRPGVHLLGPDPHALVAWSVPLGAAVIPLPDRAGMIAAVLDSGIDRGTGLLVRVHGGSGGVGATTVAAGLAQVGLGLGRSACLELDPHGPGLDLVFGSAEAPGWRWPDLRQASGRVESLVDRLPNVSGVDIVARRPAPLREPRVIPRRAVSPPGRGARPPDGIVPATAVRAVMSSLLRTHRLVVADCAAGGPDGGEGWPDACSVVVVAATVGAVSSAAARISGLGADRTGLVVRSGKHRRIHPDSVAEMLGLPLWGVVHDDWRVAEAVDPPGRARGRLRRELSHILRKVTSDA